VVNQSSLRAFLLYGSEEGREEGKIEVARRFIAKGMSAEEAAEISGVSLEMLRG
jgi:hypothetical protein